MKINNKWYQTFQDTWIFYTQYEWKILNLFNNMRFVGSQSKSISLNSKISARYYLATETNIVEWMFSISISSSDNIGNRTIYKNT